MGRRSRTAASLCGRLAVMAVAAFLSGCTMCPDPYDYAGPVPNGSSPQNDFRARSNGILPIGATPVPWPSIVKSGGVEGYDDPQVAAHRQGSRGRRGTPTLADPSVESAPGDGEETPIEPTSVLVEASSAQPFAPGHAEHDGMVPGRVVSVIGESIGGLPAPGDVADGETAGPELAAAQGVSPVVPESPVAEPPLAETPGWRPRQAR